MFFFDRGLNIIGLVVNLIWCVYNIVSLEVVVKALYYQPPEDWNAQLPEFLADVDEKH